LKKTSIKDVTVITDISTGFIKALVCVENCDSNDLECELGISVYHASGGEPVIEPFSMDIRSREESTETFELLTAIYFPKLWTPAEPFLYRVEIDLKADNLGISEISDRMEIRTAFREFTRDEEGIFQLNGRKYLVNPMKGISRSGDDLTRDRLVSAKEEGFNMILCESSGVSVELLEMCDDIGMLARIDCGWAFDDMITNLRNHPSIVAWNLSMEKCGDEVIHAMRKLDVARLVILNENTFSNPYMNRWQNV